MVENIGELIDNSNNATEIYSTSVNIANSSMDQHTNSFNPSEKQKHLDTAKRYFVLAQSIRNFTFTNFGLQHGARPSGDYDSVPFEDQVREDYERLKSKYDSKGLIGKISQHLRLDDQEKIQKGSDWGKIKRLYLTHIIDA